MLATLLRGDLPPRSKARSPMTQRAKRLAPWRRRAICALVISAFRLALTLPVMSTTTSDPQAVVAAVAERRTRSARLRRRRRQVVFWLVIALLAGTVTFAAGLLAAPVDYSVEPV